MTKDLKDGGKYVLVFVLGMLFQITLVNVEKVLDAAYACDKVQCRDLYAASLKVQEFKGPE